MAGYVFFPSTAGIVLIVAAGTVLTFSNPLLILMAQKHSGNSPAMASSLIMGVSWGLAGLAMVPLGALGEALGHARHDGDCGGLPPAVGALLPENPTGLIASPAPSSRSHRSMTSRA